jgi:hypothetical protein
MIAEIRRLDFLGSGRSTREDPHSWLLDSLGFPWILSSESRVFNGLRRIFQEEFFSTLSPAFAAPGTGAGGRGDADAQNCSIRQA